MNSKSKWFPYLIMLLPPIFWAGNFIVGRAVAEQHAPIGLSFWRWFLVMLILFPFVIKPIWKQREIIKHNFGKIVILAILSVTGFNTIVYIALQNTTATNATLLNSFIPIFILIISALFFKEKISFKQILGISISLIGVIAILTRLDSEVLFQFKLNIGDLWMLVAALVWALYSILLKYLRPKELKPLTFLGILVIIGTIFLASILRLNPFEENLITWNFEMIKAVVYIAIFPSIVSFLAWNYGIQTLGASVAGQYIHLMPLFAAFMAIVFLGEAIQFYHLVGATFIALGLWLSLKKN